MPRPKVDKVLVQTPISPGQYKQLVEASKKEEISLVAYLRKLIREHFEGQK